MSESDIIEATEARLEGGGPVTRRCIEEGLSSLGVEPGGTLLVHSSLSSIGWVCGGAQTVIYALEEVVRPFGTLVMPTHTSQLSDPAGWRNPPVPGAWWETIRETLPAFDPELTPTLGMGAIPETFRSQTEVLRSVHPHVSFAAWGEGAMGIAGEHGLDYGLGEESPLGRLYEADARVLLLGVGYEVNTAFHLAEYRADFPRRRVVDTGGPIMVDGHRRWKWFEDVDIDSEDFMEIGRAFEKKFRREILTGVVGLAETRLFRMRDCVDFAVRWMEQHRR
jgi:aminoglycoside 3-N-acetyltransferase